MAWDNSPSQLDNKSHQIKKLFIYVQFNDEPENLLLTDWWKKERKYRRITFVEKVCENTVDWQNDSWEKLLIEINKNPDRFLIIILDM